MVVGVFKPGPKNLITDVSGLKVGNASDALLKSGVTVLTADRPFAASVDVMGGAPGTRETDLLAPDKMVGAIDALVLSGGSAFGLDAASGVANQLHRDGRGYAVGPVKVPLVPAAIIFDLLNGGDKSWAHNPYSKLGELALANASDEFELGSHGAGAGATTATLKGGLGSASLVLENGTVVGALVVANPIGSATVPGTPNFWAAPFEVADEFGGLGPVLVSEPGNEKEQVRGGHAMKMPPSKYSASQPVTGQNTTLAIVATDAALDKSQLKRMAVAAQDGFARALFPSHTPFDGDLVFAVSTGSDDSGKPGLQAADQLLIGHAASLCVARAIARAVYEASTETADILPTWEKQWAGR